MTISTIASPFWCFKRSHQYSKDFWRKKVFSEMPVYLSLWHEGCSTCKGIVKQYRREGDKYIAECLREVYTCAESTVLDSIEDVAEKLREHPKTKFPAVVIFPWRRKMIRYLTWLKEQLERQGSILDAMEILGCAGHNHPLPMIPIERSKIPYISKLISELMADHMMFEVDLDFRYRKHDEFVLEQTLNVLKKMETVARAMGQEAAANKAVASLFYDIDGPSEQMIDEIIMITVNDHQSMRMLSHEEWKILTPFAFGLAHQPPESPSAGNDDESMSGSDENEMSSEDVDQD